MRFVDQYGYYTYRGRSYTSKMDVMLAAVEARDSDPDVRLWFQDDVYGAIDHTLEPASTLAELYVERARRLRDQYSYLILLYSGGSDSHQVLCSFLRAGVFVDEVRTSYPVKALARTEVVADRAHPLGLVFEYELAAKRGLEMVRRLSPRTKIVVDDYTDSLRANANDEYLALSERALWFSRGIFHNVFVGARSRSVLRDVEDQRLRGVGLVHGSDKPVVFLAGRELMFCFSDVGRTSSWFFQNEPGADLVTPEMFFWSRNAPLIVTRQCHEIKRRLALDPGLRSLLPSSSGVNFFSVADEALKPVIYPDWDINTYQKSSKCDDDAVIHHFFPELRVPDLVREKNAFYSKKFGLVRDFDVVQRGQKKVVFSRSYSVGDVEG